MALVNGSIIATLTDGGTLLVDLSRIDYIVEQFGRLEISLLSGQTLIVSDTLDELLSPIASQRVPPERQLLGVAPEST